jgi:glutamine synthetase
MPTTLTPTETAAESVARRIRDEHIETVIAGGCDLNGVFRGKFIPAARFQQQPDAPIPFCDVIYVFDPQEALIPPPAGVSGWWPRLDTGFGDFHARPDLSTFRKVPWMTDTAMVLCDHHRLDGSPIQVSPRYVLQRCVEEAETQGLVPRMAAELEFFLFHGRGAEGPDRNGPQPLSPRSVAYGVARGSRDDELIGAIRRHVAEFGIPVESSMPEAGSGQYEINLAYSVLPLAADRAFLYKHAVKEIADRHGLVASFMAKPMPGFGSSCHLHQSLWSPDGQNLFSDPGSPHGLSALAGSFIAGQLATLAELACLYAPTVNSYKRLVTDSAAPTTVSWGVENRTTALRLVGAAAESLRVENRCPGADVNVYLAMAAALAGGLYGIEGQLALPAPVAGNSYADSTLEPLPTSLEAAVQRFEQSEAAQQFLGAGFVEFYAATRRWEVEQFRAQPTDWEISRYLELA